MSADDMGTRLKTPIEAIAGVNRSTSLTTRVLRVLRVLEIPKTKKTMSKYETNADRSFESDDDQQLRERVAALEARLTTVEDKMDSDDHSEPGVPQDDGTVVCPACGHRGRVLREDGGCWECGAYIDLQWGADDD